MVGPNDCIKRQLRALSCPTPARSPVTPVGPDATSQLVKAVVGSVGASCPDGLAPQLCRSAASGGAAAVCPTKCSSLCSSMCPPVDDCLELRRPYSDGVNSRPAGARKEIQSQSCDQLNAALTATRVNHGSRTSTRTQLLAQFDIAPSIAPGIAFFRPATFKKNHYKSMTYARRKQSHVLVDAFASSAKKYFKQPGPRSPTMPNTATRCFISRRVLINLSTCRVQQNIAVSTCFAC